MSSFEREPGCGLAENVDQVIEAAFADQRLLGRWCWWHTGGSGSIDGLPAWPTAKPAG